MDALATLRMERGTHCPGLFRERWRELFRGRWRELDPANTIGTENHYRLFIFRESLWLHQIMISIGLLALVSEYSSAPFYNAVPIGASLGTLALRHWAQFRAMNYAYACLLYTSPSPRDS